MKAIVLYDSVFGNTEKIALAISDAIAASFDTQALPVGQATADKMRGLDVLIVGSPTRGFRPTEGMAKRLAALPKYHLSGIRVAAFDTRIALETIDSPVFRFIVDKGGYAASAIANALQRKGGQLLAPPAGFLVTGERGPLKVGELERAVQWARRIVLQG